MALGYLSASIAAKLLLGPLLGIGIIALMDVQQPGRNTLLVCACLPTAINALLLAVKFDARPNLVGAILVGCTLLSPITIGIALVCFGD